MRAITSILDDLREATDLTIVWPLASDDDRLPISSVRGVDVSRASDGLQDEAVIQFDHFAANLIEAEERADLVYEWLEERAIRDERLIVALYRRNTRNYPDPEPDGVFRTQERYEVYSGEEMRTRSWRKVGTLG